MYKSDILKSIEDVVNSNKYISINEKRLNKVAHNNSLMKPQMPCYPSLSNILQSIGDIVQYLFIVNTINFKFWNEDKSKYTKDGYVGSDAMFNCIYKNLWLLDAKRLEEINEKQVLEVFGEIPMYKERTAILKENGSILLQKYNGRAINILKAGDTEIPKILDLLAEIPSWNDTYQGHIFMKRAQLFLAMVGSLGILKRMEELTLFADYQVPRALEYLGILEYEKSLKEKIVNGEEIQCGSPEEIALRAFTIHAGELLSKEIGCPTIFLDYELWKNGRNTPTKYHYTKCIWY